MRQNVKRGLSLLAALLLAGALAFWGLWRWDNKYTAALPGAPGVNILQADPERVGFLVDGWEIYPGRLLTPEDFSAAPGRLADHTYAGEHPNFSPWLDSPYGEATYRLVLENRGAPRELALYLPELLCAGRVYLNGELVGEQGSPEPYRPHVMDGTYTFRAGETTELVIQCANYTHYYSGLYYPPAVGSPTAISRMVTARLLIYGALAFVALGLALSGLAQWLFERDRERFRAGLLCLLFAVRVSYPFLRGLGAPPVRLLYALEDFCGNAVLLLALLLAGEWSGAAVRRWHRRAAIPAAAALCAATVVFPLFILPYAPLFTNTYGVVLLIWRLAVGAYLLFLALRRPAREGPLGRYLLCAAGLYGASVAVSALTANRFEPIRGAWPEEYGAFALVLGYAALMVHRGVLLERENRRLTLHLREEVDRKTQVLETLLRERREVLAELLHEVKNPLTAVRGYAELARLGGMAAEGETAAYLDALNERVEALEDRFALLQGFSRSERGPFRPQSMELNAFLETFHRRNRPDMELSGQTFRLELPGETLTIQGDEKRLRSALENLCYNALSFTPEDGTVTLALRRRGGEAVITVADTGVGILPEDLPHVFDYGFTHRPDGTGEGIGLFVTRTIAMEHGGRIEAASTPGKGSVFTLTLPLAEEE